DPQPLGNRRRPADAHSDLDEHPEAGLIAEDGLAEVRDPLPPPVVLPRLATASVVAGHADPRFSALRRSPSLPAFNRAAAARNRLPESRCRKSATHWASQRPDLSQMCDSCPLKRPKKNLSSRPNGRRSGLMHRERSPIRVPAEQSWAPAAAPSNSPI